MIYRSLRGWFGYWNSFQDGVIGDNAWRAFLKWSVHMPQDKVEVFRCTLDYILAQGCQVVLVHPPVIESWQRSNPEAFKQMIQYYRDLAESDPRIHFLDYSPMYSHRQELFEDAVHVNRKGEHLMTESLIVDMKRIMGK